MRLMNRFALPVLLLAWVTTTAAAQTDTDVLDEQAILEQLKDFDPTMYQELIRMRSDAVNSESDVQYRSRLLRAAGRLKIRDDHPAWALAEQRLVEVEATVDLKIVEYRAATTDAARDELHAELLDLAGQMHDLRLDSYRFRIALLQMRLRDLETTVKTREDNRAGFIQSWLDRKLGVQP